LAARKIDHEQEHEHDYEVASAPGIAEIRPGF
jgi:hypothetical protein